MREECPECEAKHPDELNGPRTEVVEGRATPICFHPWPNQDRRENGEGNDSVNG